MAGMPVKTRPNNLPAELTSFVGRRKELSEVKRLLSATRLLTLTGSGGAGKTRLALRAAAELARGFPDGVWLVSLGSLDDPQLVVQAAFNAVGLQDMSSGLSLSRLCHYLANEHLLLVLDNCEHLLDACAVLAVTLLKSCPDLRILATSREALGVTGETRMRVPPLSLPEDDAFLTPEQTGKYEAVALLSDRAAAVLPSFKVGADNSGAVLRLCRRLDGIPLALELAAVHFEGLSVEQVVDGLEGHLPLLARGGRGVEARQQTLDATIGWSYRLLNEQERLLWARLSVFSGGFDQRAAIIVCADAALPSERVVGALAGLVEKSIVKRDPNVQPPRYALLETLRQYGRRRLKELDQEISIQARHRDWIATLTSVLGAFDSRQAELFNRIHLERDNLWAALDFCLRHPGEAPKGAKICHDVWIYWGSRGPVTDARRVVTSLLETAPEDGMPRGYLLVAAAGLAINQWDFAAIAMHSEESLRIGRRINDPEIVAMALMFQGLARMMAGDLIVALELAESALALAKAQQLRPIVLGGVTRLICNIKQSTGDLEGVVKLAEEALQLSRASGEMWLRGYLLNDIAHAVWRRGDLLHAEALAQEEVSCHMALDDRQGLSMVAEMLAWMATERRAYRRAATLFGCAVRLREAVGSTFPDHFREQHERSVSAATTGLGAVAFAAALDRGRAMTIDEIVAHALGEKRPAPAPHVATGDSASSLTRRELEIAHMIAEGLTGQQIAAKLFISERTVTTHVTNMLNKLGLGSRIQLASWVTASQSPGTRNT
jgi:predicted ATPase/DNA-binding CsgD family transcriptional regulator